MSTLSATFESITREEFRFLVNDFGFAGPTIQRQGWQFTDLIYTGERMAIRVNLDNEEQVLVYVHLLVNGTMPPRDDVIRTFLVDTVAPQTSPSEARLRGVVRTAHDMERVLTEYASALRTEIPRLLRGFSGLDNQTSRGQAARSQPTSRS